jgi:type II secretory pathway pseudopilin PulG
MKLFSNLPSRSRRTNLSAFTLLEMMMSVGIYLFIFVGVMVAIQIFGLRVYTLAATKLSATAGARKALNQIRDDIRSAKTLQVGTLAIAGSASSFAAIPNNAPAQGNALQLFPTTNAVPYTVYYLDTSGPTNFLRGYTKTSTTTNIVTLAGYITNTIVFDAEDFQGNIVVNNPKNNQVYKMELDFYQWEYPIAFIGGIGLNAYDFYRLRTRICRRAID